MKVNLKNFPWIEERKKNFRLDDNSPLEKRFANVHYCYHDWAKKFEKELREELEQAIVENTKTTNNSKLNFTAGKISMIREILGDSEE